MVLTRNVSTPYCIGVFIRLATFWLVHSRTELGELKTKVNCVEDYYISTEAVVRKTKTVVLLKTNSRRTENKIDLVWRLKQSQRRQKYTLFYQDKKKVRHPSPAYAV